MPKPTFRARLYYYTLACSVCVFILLPWYTLKGLWYTLKGLWWLLCAIFDYFDERGGVSYGPPSVPRPTYAPGTNNGGVNPMYDPAKNPWYYYDQTDPAGFARSAAFGHHRDRRG